MSDLSHLMALPGTAQVSTPAPSPAPTAAAELQAARDARIAGRMNERDYFAIVERLGPQTEVAPQAPAPPAAEAQARVQALRQQRIEGKVSDFEFHRQMATLGPAAASETAPATLTMSDEFERQRDEIMAGARPQDYQFAYPPGADVKGEVLEFDSAIRSAMSDAGIPKHLGAPIFAAVDSLAGKFANASPQAVEAHVGSVSYQLRQAWGSEHAVRAQAVADLIAQMAEKHPRIGQLVDAAPWLLADVGIAQAPWNVIEHRTRKRA